VLTITEPALLIRPAKLFEPKMSAQQIYEATRGVWKVGADRNLAEIALCVVNGVVQEVYSVGAWHPAGTTPYHTRPKSEVNIDGRWEFTGEVAPEDVRLKYVGQSVAHYFEHGNANPVNYVNIKSR